MRINYDFIDLEAFLAVLETGSFHHAADRLNVSQSAVTRRLQKLEEALGSVLFERTTRAVKPTLAAKRLQSRAEAMLESARETALAMQDESIAYAHQRNVIVTLATIPTVISSLVVPVIARYRLKHEHIRLRLLDLTANEVSEAVARGEADFGIGSIGQLEASTYFEPLFEDQIVLALPPGHPLTHDVSVSWPDLKDHTLILPARGTGNRLLIDEAMARHRLSATWTYEVGRTSTALELVHRDIGIALVPRSAMATPAGSGLQARDLGPAIVSRPIGMLSRSSGADQETIRNLKAHFRAIAARSEAAHI